MHTFLPLRQEDCAFPTILSNPRTPSLTTSNSRQVQGRKFKENLAEASAEGTSRSCGWGSGRPPPENFQESGDENQKPMTCEKHNSLLCLDLSFWVEM